MLKKQQKRLTLPLNAVFLALMTAISSLKCWLKLSSLLTLGIYFSSCSHSGLPSPAPSVPVYSAPSGSTVQDSEEMVAPANRSVRRALSPYVKPKYRPGLATEQGRKIHSSISTTHFERSSDSKPKGVATLYYNDEEGLDAMTAMTLKTKGSGLQSTAGGLVEWGIRSGFRYNSNFYSKGKRFVLGKKGREYSIVVKNKAHSMLEVVLSVDGLNVLSGQQASVKQRGYVIQPGKTLVVKGFRTAEDAVRAFKFSDVKSSLSQQLHGTTKNVGVIGIAVFTQKGVNPWRWTPDVIASREKAKAFQ